MPADSPVPLIDSGGHRPRRSAWIAAALFGVLAIAFLGWQLLFKYERDKDGNTKIEASVTTDNDQPAKAPTAKSAGSPGAMQRNPWADTPLTPTTDIARDMRVFPLRYTPAQEAADYLKERYHDAGYAIAMDQVSNSVLVRARPEQLEIIEALLSRLEEQSERKSDLRGDPATKSGKAPTDRPAHRIEQGDVLNISTAGTPPDAPIEKTHTVDIDGFVNLGAEYGKVRVVGMTADEAQDAVLTELRKLLRSPQVVISIASTADRNRDPRSATNRFEVPGRGRVPNVPGKRGATRGAASEPNRQNVPNDPNDPAHPRGTDIPPDRGGKLFAPAENSVAVLPRPQWTPADLDAKTWPERKEDLPIGLRLADNLTKQFRTAALEYRYHGDTPLVIGSNEGDIVIPYILVISGDHLGRKEYVMSWWPVRNENNELDPTPGILFAPATCGSTTATPCRSSSNAATRALQRAVRVSNIVKLKWEIPGTPTTDIRHPKDLMSPFSKIHWEENRPQVEIDDEWYELLGVDGMKASAFVEVAKEKAGDKWQEKFENGLPALLKEAGVLSVNAFVLNLRRLSDGREHTFAVQMQDSPTGKRQAVITRRHNLGIDEFHDRAGKPLGGPTLLAPFSGVGWKDGLPRVQLNGVWYDLRAVGGFPAEKIIEQAKKSYPSDHQRGFEENLEAILKDLGHKEFVGTVQVTLRRVDSGRIETILLRRADKTYGIMSRMVTGQQIPSKAKDEPKAQDDAGKGLTAATGPEPLRAIKLKRNFPHVTINGSLYALDRINNVLNARLMEEAKKMRPDDVPGAFKEEWPELLRRLKQPIGDEIELTVVGPTDDPGGGADSADGKILIVKYRGDSNDEWKLSETARVSTIGPAKRFPSSRE